MKGEIWPARNGHQDSFGPGCNWEMPRREIYLLFFVLIKKSNLGGVSKRRAETSFLESASGALA